MPRREMFPAGNKRKQKPQDPRLSAWAVCSLHSAFLVAKPLHRTTRLYKCVDDCLFLAVSFSGSRCGFPRLGIWQVPLHHHSSIRKGRERERERKGGKSSSSSTAAGFVCRVFVTAAKQKQAPSTKQQSGVCMTAFTDLSSPCPRHVRQPRNAHWRMYHWKSSKSSTSREDDSGTANKKFERIIMICLE